VPITLQDKKGSLVISILACSELYHEA